MCDFATPDAYVDAPQSTTVALFSNDGRIFYDLDALVTESTNNLAVLITEAEKNPNTPAEVYTYLLGVGELLAALDESARALRTGFEHHMLD